MPYKVKTQNLLVIASKAKTALHPGRMQAIQNFIQETRRCDNRVNKKPPNLMRNREIKPTF